MHGAVNTYYGLVLIPEAYASPSFNTIHDAQNHGAELLQIATGPP